MINFLFNKIFNDQDFAKLIGGLDKGGTGQRRIRYNILLCIIE